MAKELVYDVKMKTQDAEKGLDKVKGKVKELSTEEKKAAQEREAAARKRKADQDEAINSMGLFGVTVGGVKKSFQGLKATSKALFFLRYS